MKKKMTCIECPEGCVLTIEIEGEKIIRVSGHKCQKGEEYAIREIESPYRILTSTVLAEGLTIKMIPVRTDKPILKKKIFEAIDEIKKAKVSKPVSVGSVIIKNLSGTGADLISTRKVD